MVKKMTNSKIEAKLRAMHLEDCKNEMMPLEKIKERAAYEYKIRQRIQMHKQKSGMFRRLTIAVSIAICLISASFLFSVLAPTFVSSANDFMRRAGIWINDVLQLGIEVERPIESEDDGLSEVKKSKTDFSSVEEASEYFGVPLLKLRDDVDGYSLTPPKAELGIDPFYRLQYTYTFDGYELTLNFEHVLTETHVDIRNDAETIESDIGNFSLWKQSNRIELLLIQGEYIVRVSTSFSQEDLLLYLNLLEWTSQRVDS